MLPFVKRDVMEYEIGKSGRVVVMRLHDGDPIYASIENVAKRENIGSAAVWAAAPRSLCTRPSARAMPLSQAARARVRTAGLSTR